MLRLSCRTVEVSVVRSGCEPVAIGERKLGLVDEHIHLACFECGRVEEFAGPLFEELKAEISRQKEFQIQVVRLEVGGRCSLCRDSTNRREARREKSSGRNGRTKA